MSRSKWLSTIAAFGILALTCAPVNDPTTDYNNAKIIPSKSLSSLPSIIKADSAYQCTAFVQLPGLVDSFKAVIMQGTSVTTLREDSLGDDDSLVTFTLDLYSPGDFFIKIYLYIGNGTVDSLVKNFGINSFIPEVSADSVLYHIRIGDSLRITITVYDPDGDFKQFILYQDSIGGTGSIVPVSSKNDSIALYSTMVHMPVFDTLVLVAQAVDSAGNGSQPLTFHVAGYDTAAPACTLLSIKSAPGDTLVRSLPCSLYVLVKDKLPIDTLTFAQRDSIPIDMLINGDTGWIAISKLDSGSHNYIIKASDRNGNRYSIMIRIHYTGTKTYPPKINARLTNQIDSTGHPFRDIPLDSCVDINAYAPYTIDSLRWTLIDVDTVSNKYILLTLDTITRTVHIACPDTYWSGSRTVMFVVTSPGNLMAGKNVTFIKIDEPPLFVWSGQCRSIGKSFDTIFVDTIVSDPDDRPYSLSWTIDTSKARYFTYKALYSSFLPLKKMAGLSPINPIEQLPIRMYWTRRWAIIPKSGVILPTGAMTDTLVITASDKTTSIKENYILKWSSLCNIMIIKDPRFGR
jgi:hypothetical protein